MSDLPEENSKPEGFIKKFTAYWDTLSGSIKKTTALITAISALIAAILLVFTQYDKIIERFSPSVSDETLKEIVYLDTLEANIRTQLFNDCSKYELQCLDAILTECENMRFNNIAQEEAIAWIYNSDTQIGNNEVFDACKFKAVDFLNNRLIVLNNEKVMNGFDFYIKLFSKFKPTHEE